LFGSLSCAAQKDYSAFTNLALTLNQKALLQYLQQERQAGDK